MNLQQQLQNLSVMIIEPKPAARRRLERLALEQGFRCAAFFDSAKNAYDSLLTGSKYDIVFIDAEHQHDLPVHNFLLGVRQMGATTPIVFLTTNKRSLCKLAEFFEVGATDVIESTPKELLKAMLTSAKIEAFRAQVKEREYASLKRRLFFRLEQSQALA